MPESLQTQHRRCRNFKTSFGFNLEDRQSWFPGLLQRPLLVGGFFSTDVREFWVQKFIINICIQYIRKNVWQNLSIFIRRVHLNAYIIFLTKRINSCDVFYCFSISSSAGNLCGTKRSL